MRVNFFDTPATTRSGKMRRAIIAQMPQCSSADYVAFGYDYFDNPHLGVGYGGYRYDGRFADAALAMCEHYGLKRGDKVLEVGCAKGYVLVEFYRLGMQVAGVDASMYATNHAHIDISEYVQLGDICELPFDNDTFDLVFGKDVLAHIPARQAILECMRVSKGPIFFEVQCGRTPLELKYMSRWDITYRTLRTPIGWNELLQEVGFTGDVHYKIIVPED